MSLDYTDDCLKIINDIIRYANDNPVKPSEIDMLNKHGDILASLKHPYSAAILIHLGSPKDVYQKILGDDVANSAIAKWAISWAKDKGLFSHHGPAGSKAWVCWRTAAITKSSITTLGVSPFNPMEVSNLAAQTMKHALAVQKEADAVAKNAIARIETAENKLVAERQRNKFEKRLNWA